MHAATPSKLIDLTPRLLEHRRERRRALLHRILALWTQYLALAALALYGLLRLLLYPQTPLGLYTGPLAVLWPVSFLLLLTSYIADLVLWRE